MLSGLRRVGARAFAGARAIATEAPVAAAGGATENVASSTPRLFALERKDPFVYARLSYLDPETRPANKTEALRYVPLSSHVFNTTPHQHAMHLASVYYQDAMRNGTASTKTRSEVNFSGRKLRPQKGSGRARLSDAGSPMLRGGGVAHGPRPRDFATELPRKVRELALRSVLSARWREGSLHVVPSLSWQPPPTSTGRLSRLLRSKEWDRALFLTAPRAPMPDSEINDARPSASEPQYEYEQFVEHAKYVRNFENAARNLPMVELIQLHKLTPHERPRLEHAKRPGELHAYQVLRHPLVIMDLGALEWLEEKLGGAMTHELNETMEAESEEDVLLADDSIPTASAAEAQAEPAAAAAAATSTA
ncbi:54S ribosomal protein yml6, mitochondrial [Malassezia cuniculi]|uniref:Large ribosomal subunit protein uL4m n=1 Tax=Malassezia cuniculi TaxID=948313 RepID=A0AAF0EQE2_9BASI|nr:54S ribosomal protein yml6, mitochondrial [Malassezia cuniculi]